MKACNWCGSVGNLTMYKGVEICDKCRQSAETSTCRRCGSLYPEEMMLKGLCLNCLQLEETKKQKQREEAKIDISDNSLYISSPLKIDEEYFEQLLTHRVCNESLSPRDFKKSPMYRRLWLMVKLNANGIMDETIINDNIEDLESLIEEHMSDLIGNKCRIFIIYNMADRKKLDGKECIAHKGRVYIVREN